MSKSFERIWPLLAYLFELQSASFGKYDESSCPVSFLETPGKYLQVLERTVLATGSMLQCTQKCKTNFEKCNGINFKVIRDHQGRHVCEIFRKTQVDAKNMIEHRHWTYLEKNIIKERVRISFSEIS